jgi:hypothetical protein
MGLNLHGIVRGAIEVVNDDVDGTVYVNTGRTNVRGILTPTFTPVSARLQVQAQKHTPLAHERGLEYSNSFLTIYAYGNFADVERRMGTGGDMINVPAGPRIGWYYVTTVLEWWPDWCALEVTTQLNAPNIQTLLAQIQNGANP